MEETLSSLRSIGAEEISKRTHITLGKVHDILDKKYDKFDRVKVLGFIKIIEREFKVDLSQWLEEFYEYNKDMPTEAEELELRTDFIEKKDSGGGFWKLLVLLIAVVAIGGFLAYKQGLIKFSQSETLQEMDKSEASANSSSDEKKSDEARIEEMQDTLSPPNGEVIDKTLATTELVIAESTNQEPLEEARVVEDINVTSKEVSDPTVVEESLEFKILPRSKVWIGKIDLKSNQKESLIVQEEYVLDVDDKILLTTGHGDLSIAVDGNITEYRELDPLRFVIDKSGARVISLEEFKRLNGGNSW